MASRYALAIIDIETEAVVTSWPPRSMKLHGHDESDGPFITALCEHLSRKGIGPGTTTAHVLRDLREAWQELCHELKVHV